MKILLGLLLTLTALSTQIHAGCRCGQPPQPQELAPVDYGCGCPGSEKPKAL